SHKITPRRLLVPAPTPRAGPINRRRELGRREDEAHRAGLLWWRALPYCARGAHVGLGEGGGVKWQGHGDLGEDQGVVFSVRGAFGGAGGEGGEAEPPFAGARGGGIRGTHGGGREVVESMGMIRREETPLMIMSTARTLLLLLFFADMDPEPEEEDAEPEDVVEAVDDVDDVEDVEDVDEPRRARGRRRGGASTWTSW
ncbi:hypothetical protein DFH09DRAFT_1177998, partial [Mycena vulgaris]